MVALPFMMKAVEGLADAYIAKYNVSRSQSV